MRDPLIGRTLGGKFTLESLIGTGAMGAVYRAHHVALEGVFAVKIMHDDVAVDDTFAERFHREARAASRLDHPNLIRVVDFGLEPDGTLYLVMEYVEGQDLYQVIRQDSPLPESRIIDLLTQVLSGVGAAHAMGVIHRDLKPENIMVARRIADDGKPVELVKVCDFGIAQISEPPQSKSSGKSLRTLTSRGVLLGTPQYMSPEQARGEPIDARTDIYSLGIILYQLLTGRLPFDAATPIDIVVKHISEDVVPPRLIAPGVSSRLEAVCMKALNKAREGRFDSARAMRTAIHAAPISTPTTSVAPIPALVAFGSPMPMPPTSLASTEVAKLPPGEEGTRTFSQRLGKRKRVIALASVAAVACLLGVVFILSGTGSAEDEHGTGSQRPKGVAAENPPPAVKTAEPAQTAARSAMPDSPTPPDRTTKNSSTTGERPGRVARAPGRTRDEIPGHDLAQNGVAENVAAATAAEPSPDTHAPVAAALPEGTPAKSSSGASSDSDTANTPVARTGATEQTSAPFQVRADALHVRWHVAQVGGGATAGGVVRSLSRAATAWNACYATGLRARQRRVEAQGTLRLSCDEQGRVISAEMSGLGMNDVAQCIRSTVAGITIPNADTGEAWATVALTLAVAE